MSIELHEKEDGKVRIQNLLGKLAKEDYAHVTPEIKPAVKSHGKVRMLDRMHDFHGWSPWGFQVRTAPHLAHLVAFALRYDTSGGGNDSLLQVTHHRDERHLWARYIMAGGPP